VRYRHTQTELGRQINRLFHKHSEGQKAILGSHVQTLRQDLRTVFKLIRNDCIHNFLDADEVTAHTILFRGWGCPLGCRLTCLGY
jgi:hypothetical protein